MADTSQASGADIAYRAAVVDNMVVAAYLVRSALAVVDRGLVVDLVRVVVDLVHNLT